MSGDRFLVHQVVGTTFSFYSDKDIRNISVKRVTSAVAFDGMQHAIQGGLYDPALGPTDPHSQCPTCRQTYENCPGHMGHIDLLVPVYNPLLIVNLFKLLRSKCFSCHRFKMAATRTRVYRVKLLLCDCGMVKEAAGLDDQLAACDGDTTLSREADAERRESILRSYEKQCSKLLKAGTFVVGGVKAGMHARELRRDVMAEFLRNMPVKKCHNCQAPGIGLRKDGYTKFFQSRVTAKAASTMRTLGLSYVSALEIAEGGTGAGGEGDDTWGDSDGDEDMGEEESKAAKPVAGTGIKSTASSDKATFLTPSEVEGQLKLLWEREKRTVKLLWAPAVLPKRLGAPDGWKVFFLRALPVAPARFRPPTKLGDATFEHPQNFYLAKVLNLNAQLKTLSGASGDADTLDLSKAVSVWIDLQEAVNSLFDSTKSSQANDAQAGIRQLLEKKEGLFRQNMMGKRVNYAARSVISPDPFIEPNQIGVPKAFAMQLTYPQPVTPWNVHKMREAIVNGPDAYPGANYLEDEAGRLVDLSKRDRHQREALSKTLLTPASSGAAAGGGRGVKRVWRHLINNDVVLMNRQPTLHRPSIMAHRARVLKNSTQKTIRMHYANCNTYNADFDGDEMNMHFPQDELARAEAYELVATPYNYCVPTNGEPLRGLIQDHIDMGVRLTSRDTFLNRDQYQQLVYAAVSSLPRFASDPSRRIPTLPPAILLPKPMWTGKQVVSTLLQALLSHLPEKARGFNMDSKTKVSASAWGISKATTSAGHPDEHLVTVRGGDLLTGVMDKSQLGSKDYGLIHCVYELYGPMAASSCLSAFGRLLTVYLQKSAVTCGIEDLILTPEAERERRRLLDSARGAGVAVASKFAGYEDDATEDTPVTAERVQAVRNALQQKLTGGEAVAEGAAAVLSAKLDDAFKGKLNDLHSSVINACLPNGQLKPFPVNNLSLIIFSGAKGSLVNHAMISCGLGQQELEGRRVPVMTSGKTLPSFAPYDPNPRAGGYIGDRFLTGLRPQEYFFHCMSGREGLVDTAVKTSRSGYLQRCIMKHLEDLCVSYDYSVRDSDGNLVQFMYGDDGIDVTQTKFMHGTDANLTFIARNHSGFSHALGMASSFFADTGLDVVTAAKHQDAVDCAMAAEKLAEAEGTKKSADAVSPADAGVNTGITKRAAVLARRLHKAAAGWTPSNVIRGWFPATVTKIRQSGGGNALTDYELDLVFEGGAKVKGVPLWVKGAGVIVRPQLPDPVMSTVNIANNVGAISEALQDKIKSYTERDPALLFNNEGAGADDEDALTKLRFTVLMWVKFLRSTVNPGEPVGTLAAQSVGEPSTQMTLNTFHLAGHGGVNVTLGIPRLREIIMTASQHIKTPAMTLPLRPSFSKLHAKLVARRLDTLRLSDLIAWHRSGGGIRVTEKFTPQGGVTQAARFASLWERMYRIRLHLSDRGAIQRTFQMSFRRVAAAVGKRFTASLLATISADVRRSGGAYQAQKVSGIANNAEVDDGSAGDEVSMRPLDPKALARAAKAKKARGKAVPGPTPAAGDDSDDSAAGSDSDAEEMAGASGGAHKKKALTYGQMDDEEKELLAAEEAGDSDEDVDETNSGDDDNEDDEEANGAAAKDGASSDSDTGASPARKKRRGGKKDKKSPFLTYGDLPHGASVVDVPASVRNSPRFAVCYAHEEEGWVEVVLKFPASYQKLLMLDAAERAADKTLVRATKGVSRALVMQQRINGQKRLCVQTEGVNLSAAASLAEWVDINAVDTNDIGAVLRHFGVEAARAAIVKEVKTVFGVYGIAVDPRHLGLIADYMTQSGGYRPFNRIGINALSSPLLKMSFETTTKFLTAACLHGEQDAMDSPSARIVCGRPVGYGTGAFDVLMPLVEE